MLKHRYYSYKGTFPIHEYGVWLEKGCLKRFFVIGVVSVTIQNKVTLSQGICLIGLMAQGIEAVEPITGGLGNLPSGFSPLEITLT